MITGLLPEVQLINQIQRFLYVKHKALQNLKIILVYMSFVIDPIGVFQRATPCLLFTLGENGIWN